MCSALWKTIFFIAPEKSWIFSTPSWWWQCNPLMSQIRYAASSRPDYWHILNFVSSASVRYDIWKCCSSLPSFENVLKVKDCFQGSTYLSGFVPSFRHWTLRRKPQSTKRLLHCWCAMMRVRTREGGDFANSGVACYGHQLP